MITEDGSKRGQDEVQKIVESLTPDGKAAYLLHTRKNMALTKFQSGIELGQQIYAIHKSLKGGKVKTGKIENGDLIRICVTDENQKTTCYDWFQIRDLEETNFPDEQIISFHLNPMMSSQLVIEKKNRSKKRLAINSFSIRRLRNKIITEIEETNEMINLETVNFYHKIRNLFLGFNGILNIKTY